MITRHALALSIIATLIGAFPRCSVATPQERDLIVLEGARYYTYRLPSLAECLPGVDIPTFVPMTTADGKGYRATWAIIDSQLFLIGVEGMTQETAGRRKLSTPELFPKVTFPFKVIAFSGEIRLKGRPLDYVIGENRITYTDRLVLQLKNGMVVDIAETTHHRELRRRVKRAADSNKR